MSYPSEDLLEIMSSVLKDDENLDTYKQIVNGFGSFVEDVILPAETKTDEARSKDQMNELEKILEEKGRVNKKNFKQAKSKLEANLKIPEDVLEQVLEQGFRNISFPEELEGLGIPYPVYIACNEVLAKASASLATKYAISNTCAEGLLKDHNTGILSDYGKEIFHKIVQGEGLAAFALTEANAPGSNIMREMKSKYVLSDDENSAIINGSKMFITNTGEADVYFVFAKNQDLGVSIFMVEPDMEGFSIGQILRKTTVQNTTFGEIVFDDLEVPLDHVVGGIGAGSEYGKRTLNSGRLTIAAIGLGIAERALEEYGTRAEEKKIAGKKLIEFNENRLVEVMIKYSINETRKILYQAAYLKDLCDVNPEDKLLYARFVKMSAIAKHDASWVAKHSSEALYHISGANAVTIDDYLPQKLVNDVRLVEFGEGVKEVLNITIDKMEEKIGKLTHS